MKVVLSENGGFVLRFDKGEEVIQGILDFMSKDGVGSCSFSGIGSCQEVELGFYNAFLKEYRKKPFLENLEIISLIGNGALAGGKPVVHAHGMFGRTDFSTVGGHVFRIVVSVTCEITAVKYVGQFGRENSPEFNLNLLS